MRPALQQNQHNEPDDHHDRSRPALGGRRMSRGALIMMMMPFLFMSGGLASVFYVLSGPDATFYRVGQTATAHVVGPMVETRRDDPRGPASHAVLMDIRFQTRRGQPVMTTLPENAQRGLRADDKIDIVYLPANPRIIKPESGRMRAVVGMAVSRLSGAVFLIFLLATLFANREPRRRKQNKT